MKNLLFFLTVLCASFSIMEAQTITWTGAGDGTNWSDANNWDLIAVPTATHDVVIPDGSTVTINVAANVNSIAVQGASTISMGNSLSFADASSIGLNSVFNWSSKFLNGGGTLTNQGTMNLVATGFKEIVGNTTLNNEGTINITTTGDLFINDGVVNNQATGIIDLQAEGGDINLFGNGSHIFNNSGTIKRSGTGSVFILAEMQNNNGTIVVESGVLTLSNPSIALNDGTYNVSAGGELRWTNTVSCNGILTGTLEGILNWAGTVNVPTVATFNFTGTQALNWSSNFLTGGGTLTNQGTMNLVATGFKEIVGNTTLNNEGTINITTTGDLFINDGVVNNQATGIIDLQAEGGDINLFGNGSHILNNSGTIKRSGTGSVFILAEMQNNNGTIVVESGLLTLSNPSIDLNDGTYNVSAGGELRWANTVSCNGILTGTIEGILNWAGTVNVPTTATFNFSGTQALNWSSELLSGGGTLTNQGTIDLVTTGFKEIVENTTLNNEGTINITTTGDLFINDGVVNNDVTGVIDLQAQGGDINLFGNGSHIFNNSGTIKRSGTGSVFILAEMQNNNGTIVVESGVLTLSNPLIALNDGTYNVSAGGELRWTNTVSCNGILTGTLEGILNWAGTVNVPTTATFNFTGTQALNWSSNFLSGGGTLTNQGTIDLVTTGFKEIVGNTTLNNEGTINIKTTGDLFINDGVVNNEVSGVIDLQAEGGNINLFGGVSHILNNFGTIKRTQNAGVAEILVEVTNYGTIEILSGKLELAGTLGFENTIDGVIKGTAILGLPTVSNYTNEGTFEPGASPGTLTVQGDFKSAPTSKLAVELNGLTQGNDYDHLAIQGNAIIDGIADVTMGFEGSINDEFIVATTTGTITQCTLATTATSTFNGQQYQFDVACRNGNEVVLRIVDKALGIGTNELANAHISLFPNPARENITLRNDSGFSLRSATITDLGGRIMETVYLNGMDRDGVISLTNYANGLYFVMIDSDEGSIIKRFMKL